MEMRALWLQGINMPPFYTVWLSVKLTKLLAQRFPLWEKYETTNLESKLV